MAGTPITPELAAAIAGRVAHQLGLFDLLNAEGIPT